MADRMQQYADWLIANQNKKGTPEFDTVANAYKTLRSQSQPQQQTPSVLGTIAKGPLDRLYAIGEGITDFIPTANKALTGYENPRLFLDTGGDGFQLGDLKSLRMMDEKDLPSNAKNPFGFSGTEFEDAADYLAANRKALNYKPLVPWNDVKANPSAANVLAFMGESAINSLPDMAAALISAPAYFASYVSPIAEKRAENNGRTQVTPEDLAIAAVAAAGIAGAERIGAKGVFGQNAGNVAQRVVGAGTKESATEAVQNPLQYAAETAGTEKGFDPAQAVDQALAGAVGGFGAGTALRTGTETLTAGGLTAPEDTEAAGDLARRMDANKKRNPKNVSQSMDTGGARALLDDAHIDISDEITVQSQLLRDRLKINKKTDTDADIKLKTLAKSGIRAAKNKTKSTATVEQMNAVEQLVGDTKEGQTLLARMREGDELTRLHNKGLKGGVSRFTDKLNPLSFGEGYATKKLVEGAGKTALYGGAFAGAGPAGPAALAGAAVGGRLIDAVTGKRSNVANYIKQNRDNAGIKQGSSPSVRKALIEQDNLNKEQRQKSTELTATAYERDDPITNFNAPMGKVAESTGLGRQQQVALAQEMLNDSAHQDIREQLQQLIKSVQQGNQQIGQIDAVISRMRAEQLRRGIVGTNNQLNNNTSQAQIPGGAPALSPLDMARRQQGISDNRSELDRLLQNAETDENITDGDLEIVRDALRDLRLDLGRNPVEAAERIISNAEALAADGQRVGAYLRPYLGRIKQQQSRNTNADQELQNLFANDPFGIGDDIAMTAIDMMPTPEELVQMKDGTFKPKQKKKLEKAYGDYHDGWMQAAGQSTPLEYTPENVDRIGRMMATEATRALQNDNSAIGWYDSKLKAAKAVMRLTEPRIDLNEGAFDFALAVTSNGQAVTENFKYALDVFRTYMDTGTMPENFKQGGARNKAMVNSFKFYNAWQNSGQNQTIDEFLNEDFTVRELKQFLTAFNNKHGTNLSVGSQEAVDATVKGSYILGPKIGQGFYQNIRGNYDPLTMDIWWMRMWNRLVGRPFEAPSQERDILKRRNIIKRGIIDNKNKDIAKVIDQALADTNETRKGLYTDPARFDKVIAALHTRYQRYYQNFGKKNGRNPDKPDWLSTVGTHSDKMGDKLMASPANASERAYMRDVTRRARELLQEQGIEINTADFQALMWYPEKQLAEKMGVAKGKGQDNDYLDAAILSAGNEGITDGQIQEALPNAERERLFGGTSATGQDGRLGSRSGGINAPEEGTASVNEDRDLERLVELVDFTEPRVFDAQASDLIASLTRMTEPEYGYVYNVDKTLPKLVKRLDPEGREVASLVQVGLRGEDGITNEEIEKIFPHLVDAFDTLLTDRDKIRGSYSQNIDGSDRRIRMTELNAELRSGKIDGRQWLDTFLHELGHAIESQSRVRNALAKIKAAVSPRFKDSFSDTEKAEAENILDQMEEISRTRRPSMWRTAEANVSRWRNAVGPFASMLPVPSIKQIAYMDKSDYMDIVELHVRAIQAAGGDTSQLEQVLPKIKQQIDYIYKPEELSADTLAAYMANPKVMKKFNPEVASLMRELVNDSKIKQFITFHSVAGLLGLTAMTSLLAGMDDDEEKGVLSLGSGALSGAA